MTDSIQPSATLTVSLGPGAGRSFTLGAAPVTIGRQAQCDIQIQDTWMSRRHARIAWTGTEYIVEDLGSTNGTFVNGERIVGPRALRTGDLLQLGDQVALAFHTRASAPIHEAPVPTAKQRRPWVWALGLLGLILVLAAGGITYYVLSDRGQPEGDTPTEEAAVPPPATATAVDTPLPVSPTATSMPTPTATPTATTTPTLTATPTATTTPTPVQPTKAPTFSQVISLGPGRFGKPLWLEVVKGEYKLVNGATLLVGSAIDVYEDWLTFPTGLAIDVKEGEITLKGTTYLPGTELVVSSQGELAER